MPNRIIREGILTSPKLARLGWPEEVFYRRLLSVVDDFGRYYADAGMLRAACYPRQLNKVSDSDVGKWLRACGDAALVRVYPAEDGESYLEVVKFDQQVRAKKSKFPEPDSTCAADATQTPANAHLGVDVSEGVGVGAESKILAAYHAALPACQAISVLNDKRKKRIAAAVKLAKRVCQSQGWEYDPEQFWQAYFGECAADDWLSGNKPNPNNPRWKQNLDVLLAEDRFAEIMDKAIASMRGAQ